MSNSITRNYTFSNGGNADGGQVDSEIQNVVNAINNADAGTARWTVVDGSTFKLGGQSFAQWFGYRRPNLQYSSGTVVNTETGLNGTSGQALILFSDGSYRTDSTSGRINCNLAQVAALSGSAQSGLDTGTVSNNHSYAVYAVKVTDSTTNFVTVASLTHPTQANYSTLNTAFGTSGWVFLNYVFYGDNSGTANAILKFIQSGNMTIFYNVTTGNAAGGSGPRLATSAGATTITFTYASGNNTATPAIPATINFMLLGFATNSLASTYSLTDSGGNFNIFSFESTSGKNNTGRFWTVASQGAQQVLGASTTQDLFMAGYIDGALGIGANPLL